MELRLGEVLYEAGSTLSHVYFPTTACGAMCASRQTSNIEVCAIGQVRKDGAMPQTVLLIHADVAKATLVKDALVNSSEGFFTIEWVERCSEAVQRLRRDGKERIRR